MDTHRYVIVKVSQSQEQREWETIYFETFESNGLRHFWLAMTFEISFFHVQQEVMYRLSEQPVDVNRVKALTRIMEEAKDKRAEKGHKILKEISE